MITDNYFEVKDQTLFPKRQTYGSACYDFYAPKDFIVPAHGISECIDSGVSVHLNKGCAFMCYVRSSFGFKYNTTLINGTGIIDSDYYPDTIKCILKNDSNEDLFIHKGDRYMQGMFIIYGIAENDIPPEEKRNGGIGSTGK